MRWGLGLVFSMFFVLPAYAQLPTPLPSVTPLPTPTLPVETPTPPAISSRPAPAIPEVKAPAILTPTPAKLKAASHGAADRNCDEFRYQEDAQAWHDAHPGDPDGLDGNDNDGRACESLPSRPAGTTVTPTPTPRVTPVTSGQPATASTGLNEGALRTVAFAFIGLGLVLFGWVRLTPP